MAVLEHQETELLYAMHLSPIETRRLPWGRRQRLMERLVARSRNREEL